MYSNCFFLFLPQRLSMELMFVQSLETFSMLLTLHKIESQVSSLTLQDLHKNQITSVSLFFCFAYRVIITIFLNSIYMC